MDPLIPASYAVPLDDGRMVPVDVVRVVEAIRELDPALDVRWVPPDQRGEQGNAFLITETRDGREYPVLAVHDESQMDARVLARLYAADSTRRDPLSDLQARELAQRELARREWVDRREEAADFALAALRSPLHRYRHAGRDWAAARDAARGRRRGVG